MGLDTSKNTNVIEFTKEEMKEYVKCKKSYVYFVENYVYIRNKEGKIVKFVPWKKQKLFIKTLEKYKWVLNAAARQTGKSIIVGSYALWLAIFYSNQNIVIMSNKGSAAKKFLKKVKLIYRYLPSFITKTAEPLIQDAVHSMEFANRSLIESINTTEEGPRGDSISLLIWDEAAFTPENIQDELWSAASPAVNNNRLLMISTFKNDDMDNIFYRQYKNSKDGNGRFKVLDHMDWTTDPARNKKWYEREKRTWIHSLAKFYREYDVIPGIPDKCDFNIMKLIELEKKLQQTNISIPIEEDIEYGLKIWEEPLSGVSYVMGVDVSEGVDKNSHACQLFKQDTLEQVAEFENNTLEISDFANVCYNLGNMYNTALMIIERNNVGHGIIKVLEESLYYENLYIGEDNRIGVVTTGPAKEKMFSYTSSAIIYDLITLRSLNLIHQMKLFKKKFTKAEKRKKKDDLVMALMVMLYGVVDLGLNNFFTELLAEKLSSEEIGAKIKIIKDRIYKYQENKNDINNPDVFF